MFLLNLSTELAKKYPFMDPSGLYIDGQAGCSITNGHCLPTNGEVKMVTGHGEVIAIRPTVVANCQECLNIRQVTHTNKI